MSGCALDEELITDEKRSGSKEIGQQEDKMPVAGECATDDDCIRTGCSLTVCAPSVSEPLFTACEFREEYGCLQYSSCSCISGTCAWQHSKEYDECMARIR